MDEPRQRAVLQSTPDTLGGDKRFPNTRIPVSKFFGCLAHGESLNEFIENFPSVTKEECLAVLHDASDHMVRREELATEQAVADFVR